MSREHFNVDTEQGLASAVAWQEAFVERCADQARWCVPRSGSIIVIDKVNKQAIHVAGLLPETSIRKVFEAMGWTWVDKSGGKS